MARIKKHGMWGALALVLLGSACVTRPRTPRPQYTWHHYKASVLLAPELLSESPKLDLGLSLTRMEYPAGQAEFLHELLYAGLSIDEYKDRIIREERGNYRTRAPAAQPLAGDSTIANWWRSETVSVARSLHQGIVVERDVIYYSGGDHGDRTKRYYVIDMEDFRQLRIDDFFASYQEERRMRDLVYEEMRKYSKLERGQGLSEGIFFTDEPELSFNFFLTDDGLGLHWDPDQIAPYFHGEIEIILPWYAVRPMMMFTGIELLTKFNIHLFM